MSVFIYCLEENNIPFYVGKANNISQRLKQHKNKFGDNINIFEVDLVQENEWKFWECFYIEYFQQLGFKLKNKNKGGGGPINHSQKTKDKISKIILACTTRNKKISESSKGISRGKGKIITWDLNIKKRGESISKSKKGKKLTSKHIQSLTGKSKNHGFKLSKIINQYDLNNNFIKEYNSITEAATSLCFEKPKSIGALTNCCKGKQKTAYGYIWKYKTI